MKDIDKFNEEASKLIYEIQNNKYNDFYKTKLINLFKSRFKGSDVYIKDNKLVIERKIK